MTTHVMMRRMSCTALALCACLVHGHARGDSSPGSLVSMEPLGQGNKGASIGGGMAVLFPFYAVEFGYGVRPRLDVVARYETVMGFLHYAELGVRWSIAELGAWRLGLRLSTDYRFFGIQTDNLNLASTLYVAGEIGASRPISRRTDLVVAAGGEFDILAFDVVEDQTTTRTELRYNGTNLRVGMKTRITRDLHGFLLARFHIPTETLQFEAQQFYVIPYAEIGGTWSW